MAEIGNVTVRVDAVITDEQYHEAMSAVSTVNERMAELQAENAKLRELAGGLGQCAQGVDCEDCLLYDLSEPDHCREERLSRELGIEIWL